MTVLRREHEDESSTSPSSGAVVTAAPLLTHALATPTRQFAALVLAPVRPAQGLALQELLQQINEQTKQSMRGRAAASDLIIPFSAIEGLHFARFVLVQVGGTPMLAFATDYDGPEGDETCSERAARSAHFARLASEPGIKRVFAHCAGCDPERLESYFERHRRNASTRFVAAPGRSVRQIRAEAALRRRVEAVLKEPAAAAGNTPREVRRYVREQLVRQGVPLPRFPAQPDLEPAISRAVARAVLAAVAALAGLAAALQWAVRWPGLLGYSLSLALTAGALLIAAGLATLRLRWLETRDAQWQPTYDAETHRRVAVAASDENHFLQNQLTHVVRIKAGPLRWLLIRAVFFALQLLATNRYNRGKLGDIPSIHFARWVLGPERTLLFFSNFDSSWQSYLGDFIDKASSGLTAVWSNTERYPRTKWLLTAGSRDAGRFLAWTRAHQIPTQVWYSAYPGLSVVNINANTEIGRGLADDEAVDAVSWLARLRNVDRTEVDQRYGEDQVRESPLELGDIQGLILKGYGHKPHARYLLFKVERFSTELVQWLSKLPVTSVLNGAKERCAADPLLNIAFTYSGMRRLRLEPELCDAFATPFVQGSSHQERARINGDVAEDAPARWRWGNEKNPVHVALLIFAEDEASLARHVQRYRDEAVEHGLSVSAELEAGTLAGRKEHFGFRDGIAQPVVKGSGDPGVGENTIPAGEILLGHRNGYDNVVAAPTSSAGFRFGFNGSYMVLRQLEQDTVGFWSHCSAQAGSGPLTAIQIASKMVGRWPSGAPLVRYPERDPGGESDDDSFGYFELSADNDRYGGRCPFGAHIRRANPRDWGLGASAAESTMLANLHRIIRRGRPYGPPLSPTMSPDELCRLTRETRVQSQRDAGGGDSEKRGLQFICFNASIERQFEFIQQQWCNNPKFAGQDSDVDPLLGPRGDAAELSIEEPGLTIQCDVHSGATRRLSPLKSFVTLRGAAYFFMPSLSALRLLPRLCDAAAERAATQSYECVPDDEQLHIDRLIDNIRTLLQRRYGGKTTLRDAHPKMHGCVRAELEVSRATDAPLRHGVFEQPGKVYKAWVRFSNEHQKPSPDKNRDTRGLALKLLDVAGDKLLDGDETSPFHDFIFLSTPCFVTRNVAQFDELIHGVVQNSRLSQLRSAPALLRHVLSTARHSSPLETTYFSVVPALLGTRPVKYEVVPELEQRSPIPRLPTADYLRERLKQQLAQRAYSFELRVLPFLDEQTTPIEDPTVRWRVAGHKVATLRILQEDDCDTAERRELGEQLTFNPFRCLPEHRPLGGINRARRQVYRAIAKFRHTRNGVTSEIVPRW